MTDKLVTQVEIATLFNYTKQHVTRLKKSNPAQFQAMKVATICNKYGITEDKLSHLIKIIK